MGTRRKYSQTKKALAYDAAIAKLKEAGLAEKFVAAIEADPSLMQAIEKITPRVPTAPMADWSCCITVGSPLRNPGGEVINPVIK